MHRALRFSSALALAVAAAARTDPEPCPACLDPESAGLCHSEYCQRQVLPVLKESALKQYMASGKYHETGKARLEAQVRESTAGKRARRREERKVARARARRAELVVQGCLATP